MSESLIFFNKEGDALNFNYNQFEERFEGDILFHENSSDPGLNIFSITESEF